jgi:hypothetical protein
MYEHVRMGIHVIRTVGSIFHYLNLERKSEADRSLDVVWMGCGDVRTNASWNRSFTIQRRVRTEIHIVQTMMLGLSGISTEWHVVKTAGAVDR